jgi:hypothetical protein
MQPDAKQLKPISKMVEDGDIAYSRFDLFL